MKPITVDISCKGYAVKADIYNSSKDGLVALVLIGRTSRRTKKRYNDFLSYLANEMGITCVIFDYSGHGNSPFEINELSPAQHFLEVITVFDWMKAKFPNRKFFVFGSSYGGFLATQLTKYRKFDTLVLRAPAIYIPNDFYTLKINENREKTQIFRRDVKALSVHPLLFRASKFDGKVLLVVHEKDEQIPKETTDAYANAFNPDTIVIKDATHSLDNFSQKQIQDYNQQIFDWLAKNIKKDSK